MQMRHKISFLLLSEKAALFCGTFGGAFLLSLKCVSKQKQTHTHQNYATFANFSSVFALELLFLKRRGHVGASRLYFAVINVKVKQTASLRHSTRLIVFRYRQTIVLVVATMDQ